MTAVQRRRRLLAAIAAAPLAAVAAPSLVRHLLRGDGVWLLAFAAAATWTAWAAHQLLRGDAR